MDDKHLCPIVEAVRVIGSEPKLIVVRFLSQGGKGFNELLRDTELSSKTLSATLKSLETSGLVERKVVNLRPFKVRYELTEKGKELEPVLEKLGEWGNKWVLNSSPVQPSSQGRKEDTEPHRGLR